MAGVYVEAGSFVDDDEYPEGAIIPGIEDWIEIAHETRGGWEWEEIRVYYSPASRRYFWDMQAGCSCNWWEATSLGQFQDGSRESCLRALGRMGFPDVASDVLDFNTKGL